MGRVSVYLEVAPKRTFAGAVDWPGWERAGRDETAAIEAFVAAGPRYRQALGRAASGLTVPTTADELDVIERRVGGSGTEFGVPSYGSVRDEQPVSQDDLDRLTAMLRAAWSAFDTAAEAADRAGVQLRKGPRGGGRDVPKIVGHVLEAETAYLREIGGRPGSPPEAGGDGVRMAGVLVDGQDLWRRTCVGRSSIGAHAHRAEASEEPSPGRGARRTRHSAAGGAAPVGASVGAPPGVASSTSRSPLANRSAGSARSGGSRTTRSESRSRSCCSPSGCRTGLEL